MPWPCSAPGRMGRTFEKLRDKWGEDLDILIHVVDVNGDELYRVKNNIPLRGKGGVRSEADQQKMLDQATNCLQFKRHTVHNPLSSAGGLPGN